MKQNPRNPTTATESITQTSSQATKSIICENLHIRNPQNRKKGSSHQNQTKSRRNPKDPNRNKKQKQEKHPNKREEGTRSLRHPKVLQPNNDPKEQRVCDLRGFLANGLEVGHKTQLRERAREQKKCKCKVRNCVEENRKSAEAHKKRCARKNAQQVR
jgi:hypothetical protein